MGQWGWLGQPCLLFAELADARRGIRHVEPADLAALWEAVACRRGVLGDYPGRRRALVAARYFADRVPW